jgi:hypothetical protein
MSIFDSLSSTLSQSVQGAVQGAVAGAAQGALSGALGRFGIPALPFGGLPQFAGSSGGTNKSTQLTDFLVEVTTNGVAWSNRFYVRFSPPAKVIDDIKNSGLKQAALDTRLLTLRCDTAELPGISFMTSDTRMMGPIYRSPNQVTYTDLTLNFILSADFAEKYFFDYWCGSIRDASNLYSYYGDIWTNIDLTMYTVTNTPAYGVRFLEAWPIAVNPMQVSWQDQEYLRLGVTFAYKQWEPIVYPSVEHSTDLELSRINLGVDVPNSTNFIHDFIFGVLPSIPGGARALGIMGQTPGQMITAGVSLLGNKAKALAGSNPVTQTAVSAGVSTLNKFLGGSFGGG